MANKNEDDPSTTNPSSRQLLTFYVITFFYSVSTILGTGILGLPSHLAKPGFWPFLLIFLPALFAQSAVVYLFVELLQYSTALLERERNGKQLGTDDALLQGEAAAAAAKNNHNHQHQQQQQQVAVSVSYEEEAKLIEEEGEDSSGVASDVEFRAMSTSSGVVVGANHGPDLHFMGGLFLNRYLRILFDCAVVLHFIAILSSYGLAGPQALGEIIKTDATKLIVPFLLVATLVVIFLQRVLMHIISFMTLSKGSLLVIMIGLTGYVGSQVQESFTNDFSSIGKPFLISTIALGGVVNVMPVIFQKIPSMSPQVMKGFRNSVFVAISVCFTLNVLWALFVLLVVPQTSEQGSDSPSLANAESKGQISTVPLVEIIETKYDKYLWISWVIRIFIAISVFVSFLAIGSGFRHVIEGFVLHIWTQRDNIENYCINKQWSPCGLSFVKRIIKHHTFLKIFLYVVLFGCVFLIAVSNPKGFLKILDSYASLALNITMVLVAVMIFNARRYHGLSLSHTLHLTIPNNRFYFLFVFVLVYFSSAVMYDFVELVSGD